MMMAFRCFNSRIATSSLLLLLLCVVLVDNSDGLGVTSRLQVHLPKSLMKPDGYDHREALFGIPPYGGAIQQNVYYADSELCGEVDIHGGYPERKRGDDGLMLAWQTPYILMVDRGGCTFVQKVRNAQRNGAAGVIIADNTCLCSAGDTCKMEGDDLCETREPVMADDGSGSDISIPSFLMFKQDADPIKAVLKQNQIVRIEMAWSLPSPDDRVEYELFTTPTDEISKTIQQSFKIAAEALGSHAKFTPHMYIYDGIKAGCQGYDGENQCYNLCTNNGRYCATDPDDDLEYGISGADVVKESLRRVCIWNLYGDEDGIGLPYWDYVIEFMARCREDSYFSNEECVKDCMEHTHKIDYDQVQSCMDDSGGLEGDEANTMLEVELGEKEATGVVIVPSLYVNAAAIRGALNFATVLKAICAGYAPGSEPEVCAKCANCIDEFKCVTEKTCSAGGATVAGGGQAVSVNMFAGSLILVIFIFMILGFILWQRSQRLMQEHVKGVLAEYMPLDENNKVQQDTSVGLTEDDDDQQGEFS